MIMNCATITLTFIIKHFQSFHIFFLKKKTLWVEFFHIYFLVKKIPASGLL